MIAYTAPARPPAFIASVCGTHKGEDDHAFTPGEGWPTGPGRGRTRPRHAAPTHLDTAPTLGVVGVKNTPTFLEELCLC